MKNYELTYLISSDVSEQELKNLSEKIKTFIQEQEGIVKKTTEPSKTKLGYSIKEKEQGFLGILDFSLNPEKIANLEKKLKSDTQILRYLILNKEVPEKTQIKRALPKVEKPTTQEAKTEKVELKEIDKKIEEILQE